MKMSLTKDELQNTVSTSKTIIEEFVRVTSPELYENMECNSDYTKNPAIINVLELYQFFINKAKEYNQMIKKFNEEVGNVKNYSGYHSVFDEFDYETNYFTFTDRKFDKYSFVKQDGDLILAEYENQLDGKDLYAFGKVVDRYYDYFFNCKDYYTQKATIQPIGSIFSITISKEELTLSYGDFSLTYNFNKDEYGYNCFSYKVMDVLSGHEQELFKNIYIRIEDCPEWSKEGLYAFRKNNLEREKRLNDSFHEGESSPKSTGDKPPRRLIKSLFGTYFSNVD